MLTGSALPRKVSQTMRQYVEYTLIRVEKMKKNISILYYINILSCKSYQWETSVHNEKCFNEEYLLAH